MEGTDSAKTGRTDGYSGEWGLILVDMDPSAVDYWEPRNCLREPIPELFWSAAMLEQGVEAHLAGDPQRACEFFVQANIPIVREYIESLWGSAKNNPKQVHYLRKRHVENLPKRLPKTKDRMPNASEKREIIARDGYRCRFCGLWVIPAEVRIFLNKLYPDAVTWGAYNSDQHAAFQALWLQFDHVLPASLGGDSSIDNIVVACAGCNYGKYNSHIDQLGLIDPRQREPVPTSWDGLTRVLRIPK